MVIDARTGEKRSTIALGGEAGNTHYDSISHCVLAAVQTTNQLVAIGPVSEKIVQRYELPGAEHPHGFTMINRDGYSSCRARGTRSFWYSISQTCA